MEVAELKKYIQLKMGLIEEVVDVEVVKADNDE